MGDPSTVVLIGVRRVVPDYPISGRLNPLCPIGHTTLATPSPLVIKFS